MLGLSIVPDCSFLSPASWATARSRRNTLEPPKERVVAFMQREHVRTHSRSGGQRQRIPVGPHAESHARTGNEISAITVGSDAANPDAAISLARPGHDLAAKPGDPRRRALSDPPTGQPPTPAPHAQPNSAELTLSQQSVIPHPTRPARSAGICSARLRLATQKPALTDTPVAHFSTGTAGTLFDRH